MNKLLLSSFGGLVFLLVVLGLCLFLPAGSLAYWQGWLFLAVFGVCVVLITAYLFRYDQGLLSRRVAAGPVAEPSTFQKIIQSLAAVAFLLMFIVPGLDYRFHWSHIPVALVIFAEVMVALGLFFVFLVFRANSYTSGVVEVAAEQKVVTTGPYALVRHPMYSGALLMCIFVPIALGSWVGLPFVLPLIVVIVARLFDEEKLLKSELKGYDAYLQKVRFHLIPYVW